MNMSDKDIKEGQKSQEKASKAEKQEKKKGEDLQKKVEDFKEAIVMDIIYSRVKYIHLNYNKEKTTTIKMLIIITII